MRLGPNLDGHVRQSIERAGRNVKVVRRRTGTAIQPRRVAREGESTSAVADNHPCVRGAHRIQQIGTGYFIETPTVDKRSGAGDGAECD